MTLSFKQHRLLQLAQWLRYYSGPGKTRLWKFFQNDLMGEGFLDISFPAGFTLVLDRHEFWQRMMMAGCYDRNEYRMLLELAAPGDQILDGGAYVGFHTLALAKKVADETSGKIYAFEPHPKFYAQIRESCVKNPDLPIEAYPLALSDFDGQATFYLPPPNGWQGVEGSLQAVPGWKTMSAETITLDTFLAEQKIGHLTFAKLDLEGSEPQVLRGAKNALRSGVLESLSCEISINNRKEVFEILNQYNFDQFFFLNTFKNAPPKNFDNLTRYNVFWLRGKCYERWKKMSFLKRHAL